MKKNKKDPLKPDKDVKITDKETGFLSTLNKVINKKKNDKKA